ncbi:MAG: ATP-dependent Clp protease ATP-binding subunit, partial [Bacteroidetes bacterium]|nr:ATP-dependent Clp protease ATP-binding subunit [Candidatus Cryptobacteroides faecigallinarum]
GAIRRNRAGIKDPGRPVGSFLFLGPTGVGKTQLAKVLAEYLFGSQENIIRIDMSEYMEKFSVSRLIGAPPGYVGYEEGGQLTERVRKHPYSVVLLDEIEKAHHDIFNLLLQVLDEGRLTDSNGRTVDFRNTILVMTSNAGSREMAEYGNGLGFMTSVRNVQASRQSILEKSVSRIFPPEFLNRIDARVMFRSLDREDMEKIIDIELKNLRKRASDNGYRLNVTPAAKRFIAEKGYDPGFGARPLKRAIQRYVEDPVSEFIISRTMLAGRGTGTVTLKIGLSPDHNDTAVSLGSLNIDKNEVKVADDIDKCIE